MDVVQINGNRTRGAKSPSASNEAPQAANNLITFTAVKVNNNESISQYVLFLFEITLQIILEIWQYQN